ncbi:hypothetical protein [Streptomyces sp. Ac-502]|uniref:hypothetical protein n=1 Tax=Streptomyces sp. Ac-502 TaxID=3342801 RepID=UPI00386244EE
MTTTPSSAPAPTHHVRAVLSTGGMWQAEVIELPEVRDAHRSLSQLESRVRKAIAQVQGGDAALHLEFTTSTGDAGLDERIAEARELRRQALEMADRARAAAVPLAQLLVRHHGVSVRDAGTLLDYSGGAISTMTKTPTS